jgi:hypothetical protein
VSDGLIPPANAPYGQQIYPGVQPGVSAVQLANVVLVFGPTGSAVGVFVYAAGTTPGLGNPPVISITEASADPFGNTVSGGVTVGLPSSTQVQIQSVGGAGVLAFLLNHAGFNSASFRSIAGAFAQLLLNGPSNNFAGHTDLVSMQWNSSDGSSSANFQVIYNDAASSPHGYAVVDSRGLGSPAAYVNAVEPGTGTVATPAVGESPHAATLKNGWTGSGKSYNGAFYWVDPDITASPVGTKGQLHIAADLLPPAGVGLNSVFMTLPPNWIPQLDQDVGGVAWNNPQANNSASLPWVNINNVTGDVQMTGIEANVNMWFHIIVPMGTL